LLLGLVVALGVLGTALPAQAQGYRRGGYYGGPPPPPRGVLRSGFVLGGSIGIGGIFFEDCDGCDGLGGLALQFDLGGMVSPTVAILFDGAINLHWFDEDNSVLSSHTYTGAVRGWVTPNLWLQGGLGLALLEAHDEFGFLEDRFTGFALVAAGGVELVQLYNFTLDLQLRVSASRFDDRGDKFGVTNLALLLGINWY